MLRRPKASTSVCLLPALVTVLSAGCKGNRAPTPPPPAMRPGNPPEPDPPPSPPTPPLATVDDAGRLPVLRVDPQHPPTVRAGAMRHVLPRPPPAPAPRSAGRARAAATAAPAPVNQPPPEHPLLQGSAPGLYLFHDHAPGERCNAIPDPEFQVALTQAQAAERSPSQPTSQPTP